MYILAWGETPPDSKRQHDRTGALISADARGSGEGLDFKLQEAFSSYVPSPTSKAWQFLRGNPMWTEECFPPLVFAAQDKEPNDLLDVSSGQDSECLPWGLQILPQGHSYPLHTQQQGPAPALANILSTGQ